MALMEFRRGPSSRLDSLPIKDGSLIVTTDKYDMYADVGTERILMNSTSVVDTLPNSNINSDKLYFLTTNNSFYKYNESLSKFVKVTATDEIFGLGINGLVPGISEEDAKKFLRGDGTWALPVESSTTNGNIKINGEETNVYTHPAGTNPHGTTKEDLGLGNVENKSSEIIRGELTKDNVINALGYTPPTTNTTYGIASDTVAGLIKSGGDITVDTEGVVSVNDNSHAHTIANVTGLQTALDGKAPTSHGTHVTYATTAPKAPGTATVGTSEKVSREDHVHPLQTTISGNAGSATKLQNARTISLTGDVTGSGSFDGSGDLSITTSITKTVSLEFATDADILALFN